MLSFAPVGIVAVILYLIYAISWKRRVPLVRHLLSFVLFVYILGVTAVTLFPIPISPMMVSLRHLTPGESPPMNVVPFSTIVSMVTLDPNHLNAFINLAGNVVLFVPFGFLVPMVFKSFNRALQIILLGFAATVLIELCQLTVSYTLDIFFRSFDVDDIILNTTGVIIGYVLLYLVQRIQSQRKQKGREYLHV